MTANPTTLPTLLRTLFNPSSREEPLVEQHRHVEQPTSEVIVLEKPTSVFSSEISSSSSESSETSPYTIHEAEHQEMPNHTTSMVYLNKKIVIFCSRPNESSSIDQPENLDEAPNSVSLRPSLRTGESPQECEFCRKKQRETAKSVVKVVFYKFFKKIIQTPSGTTHSLHVKKRIYTINPGVFLHSLCAKKFFRMHVRGRIKKNLRGSRGTSSQHGENHLESNPIKSRRGRSLSFTVRDSSTIQHSITYSPKTTRQVKRPAPQNSINGIASFRSNFFNLESPSFSSSFFRNDNSNSNLNSQKEVFSSIDSSRDPYKIALIESFKAEFSKIKNTAKPTSSEKKRVKKFLEKLDEEDLELAFSSNIFSKEKNSLIVSLIVEILIERKNYKAAYHFTKKSVSRELKKQLQDKVRKAYLEEKFQILKRKKERIKDERLNQFKNSANKFSSYYLVQKFLRKFIILLLKKPTKENIKKAKKLSKFEKLGFFTNLYIHIISLSIWITSFFVMIKKIFFCKKG